MICERSGHIAVEVVWARTAKKSAKPEEPKIEGKKCERHRHDDAARGRPEQDQRADFPRIARIVVNFDLITGLHHSHADLAAATLPGMGLSIDDLSNRSAGVGKGVWRASERGRHVAKVLRLHHSDDCLGPVGFSDRVGQESVNAGSDDDDAVKHNRE